MKKWVVVTVMLLAVSAYAEVGGTPADGQPGGTPAPTVRGGTVAPDSKKAVKPQGVYVIHEKLPKILVCTCADGGYATNSGAAMSCKYESDGKGQVIRLDNLYAKHYRLIQIVDTKDGAIYYFDRR